MHWGEDALTLELAGYVVQLAYPLLAVAVGAVLLFGFTVQAVGLLDRYYANRGCRWKRAAQENSQDPIAKWSCKVCGIEAYSTDGKPPKECKKALKPAAV